MLKGGITVTLKLCFPDTLAAYVHIEQLPDALVPDLSGICSLTYRPESGFQQLTRKLHCVWLSRYYGRG